jgi:hypothetical protein
MVIKGIFPLFFLSLTATVGFAEEISYDYNHGLGPLEMLSQSPAQSLRMTLPMVVPGGIKPGWGAHAHTTWTNVWADETNISGLQEMLDTVLAVTYGFNKRFGLAVTLTTEITLGVRWILHPGVYDLFGIRQSGRTKCQRQKNYPAFDPKPVKQRSNFQPAI